MIGDKGDAVAVAVVLKAFWTAQATGLPAARCYRAGVEAWKSLHPDHSPAYAARRAVEIILEERRGAIMKMREDA